MSMNLNSNHGESYKRQATKHRSCIGLKIVRKVKKVLVPKLIGMKEL